MAESTAHDRLLRGVSKWMSDLEEYPGWKDWNREKLRKTMHHGDPFWGDPADSLSDFVFSSQIDAQHAVVWGYLNIAATVHSLADLEFYFRRYPFRGLPVSKHEHLSNVCEMYFSRFYEFRERARSLLNAVNEVTSGQEINVGRFLKDFDKRFDAEIRERHGVHHRARFDDIQINKVWLTQMLASSRDSPRGWDREHQTTYRAVVREWAERVRRQAAALDRTKERVAVAILECCPFLVVWEEG